MSFGAQVELKLKKSNVAKFNLFVFLGLFLSLKARLRSWACASSTGVCSTFFRLVDAKGLFQLNRFDNKMLAQLTVQLVHWYQVHFPLLQCHRNPRFRWDDVDWRWRRITWLSNVVLASEWLLSMSFSQLFRTGSHLLVNDQRQRLPSLETYAQPSGCWIRSS